MSTGQVTNSPHKQPNYKSHCPCLSQCLPLLLQLIPLPRQFWNLKLKKQKKKKLISLKDAIEIIESGGIEYCKPEPKLKTKTKSSKIKNFFFLPFPFLPFPHSHIISILIHFLYTLLYKIFLIYPPLYLF